MPRVGDLIYPLNFGDPQRLEIGLPILVVRELTWNRLTYCLGLVVPLSSFRELSQGIYFNNGRGELSSPVELNLLLKKNWNAM